MERNDHPSLELLLGGGGVALGLDRQLVDAVTELLFVVHPVASMPQSSPTRQHLTMVKVVLVVQVVWVLVVVCGGAGGDYVVQVAGWDGCC